MQASLVEGFAHLGLVSTGYQQLGRPPMAMQRFKKCGNWFSEEGSEQKVCGAILVAVFLIGGFATDQAFYGIAGALVMALITAIVWAANQVFIGIAKDVRAIRQKS